MLFLLYFNLIVLGCDDISSYKYKYCQKYKKDICEWTLYECLEIKFKNLLHTYYANMFYPTLKIVKLTEGENGLVGLDPAAVDSNFIPVACDHQ